MIQNSLFPDLGQFTHVSPIGEEPSIQQLTDRIVGWADRTFPQRTQQSALLKMYEEIGELVKDPKKPDEYADICIMLFDLASMNGVNIAQAIEHKMYVNEHRTWRETETGTMQHLSDEEVFAYECGVKDSNNGCLCQPMGYEFGTSGDQNLITTYEKGYHDAAGA
jgi:hypothetical protein